MKTLIWKELRENIVWAVLLMVALGGTEVFALHHLAQGEPDYYYFMAGVTLCKSTFLMTTLFGSAATGMLLGFLQVLPELKRDRWAALLHRPVDRGQVFWGKALAGAVLYLIAAGLPLAFSIWHVSRPGNFPAPFEPGMVKPGVADLIVGFGYYFAALLVALQGGSILLRALPLFAALHVSFFSVHEDLFRVAVEAGVAMSVALCIAGWGAIYSGETLRHRPWVARLAFFVVVFYGACGLGDLAKQFGGIAGQVGDHRYSYWQVLDDGSPARFDHVNNVLVAVTDVNGKPFSDPKYQGDRANNHTLGMNTACSHIGDDHGKKWEHYPSGYRQTETYLYAGQPYSHPRLEQWFHINRGPYYVGMLPLENAEFAVLGMDGFAAPGTKVRPFPEDVSLEQISGDLLVIAAPDSLRFVRLSKRKITDIPLPAPAPIYGVAHAWSRMGNSTKDYKGVAFGTAMAVYDVQGHVAAMLPYRHDVDRWGRLWLGILGSQDRFVLHYDPSDWIDEKTRRTMPSYVDLLDAQGNVVTAYTLPQAPPSEQTTLWSQFFAQRLQSPAFFFGEMLYRRIGAALGSTRLRDALAKQLGPDFANTRRVGMVVVLVALVLAVVVFFWARRAQLPERQAWGWAVAVFCLGLGGLIVFWLASGRPRTVRCQACGQRRRIDAEVCGCCGAPWPAKPSDETAILDPLAEPATVPASS